MNAKEYLKKYEAAEIVAKRLRAEYHKEEEMIDAIKSTTDFDGMPKSRSGGRSAVEDRIIRLADKAAELKEAEIRALEVRQEVFNTINKVPGEPGKVLYEKYINLLKWEEVAVKLNYSWSGTHKLHKRALHIVAGLISE